QAGLDRGDVERELEGRPQADRASFEVVGLGGGETTAEVRDDVHEQRRGGHASVLDADRVVDRLDRRPRLAPAVGENVELRLELAVPGRRVARRTGIREDLAGPVVDDGG